MSSMRHAEVYPRDREGFPGPDLDRPVYGILAWIGVVVEIGAVIWLAVNARWDGVMIMAAMTVGCVLTLVLRTRLPKLFALLFVIVSLTNAAGYVWDLFQRIVWYDEALHFGVPMVLGLVFMFWWFYAKGRVQLDWWAYVWVTLAVLAVGVAWEVFEWMFDFIGPWQDTISDVVLDLLGGLAGAILGGMAVHYCHPDCLRD